MAAILQYCLIAGVFIPLLSFFVIALFGRRLPVKVAAARHAPNHAHTGDSHHHGADSHPEDEVPNGDDPARTRVAGWIATSAIGLSLLLSVFVLLGWTGYPEYQTAWSREAVEQAPVWIMLGSVPVEFGVKLDSLTVIMFLMVTGVATCVHVFSLGYMKTDAGGVRFFAFLSAFSFAMLGLVISSNLLLLFIFWELVGACSYFLIGHWFHKPAPQRAALQAFVVNRIGDAAFIAAMGLLLGYLGTLSLDKLPALMEAGAARASVLHTGVSPAAQAVGESIAERAAQLFTTQWLGISLATWLGIGLLMGAMGKSAQVPMHVWLPDAMEGPTPVSALIHAATMVAAGVYMLARVYSLLTHETLMAIAVIGCLTITVGALLALVQNDLKRVLAYSTLSQLGYMVFAIGIGAWIAALFHLLTHAFFKALLFLGSGQVIAACHHEQDMRKMGGLMKSLPQTAICFLVAILAISGFGIPMTSFGIGGFFSKDEILLVGWHHGTHGELAPWLVALPLIVAYLTPFYMGRCFMLTFLGPSRIDPHHVAPESPVMVRPLLALAFMTLVCGIPVFFFRNLVAAAAPTAALVTPYDAHAMHEGHGTLALLVGFAWIIGLGTAYLLYRKGNTRLEAVDRMPLLKAVRTALENRLYFDRFYAAAIIPAFRAVVFVSRLFDEWVIDAVSSHLTYVMMRVSRFSGLVMDDRGVDGAVRAVGGGLNRVGGALRGVQTGMIRNYMLLAMLGATGFIVFVITGDGGWTLLLVAITAGLVFAPWRDIGRRLASEP
ncbi:MAG: NADH-quinone oxidoreductase subunit L [Phycisphaerales bacterium]|nr:NADH-quinone oxidoreductase subunit L [Phycisphaerales bacterium]